MATMSERVQAAANDLAKKAEHYAETASNPQALVQQVMQMGMSAITTRRLAPADGERIAALMIAAVALARGDIETKKPSEEGGA